MLKDWKTCIREVGKTLSRYDGYSTFAKMGNILSIPTSTLFEDNPSCYAAELISEVENLGVKRRPAQDHLRHGISLGFLERVISGGGMFRPESGSMKKIDETARIALSPLGRVLRAADKLEVEEFRHFVITCSLLDHDFDMYGLLLRTAKDNNENKVNLAEFQKHFEYLIQQRREWLERNIPVRSVREQICGYVPWMARHIKDTSIKHHFNMRKHWAKYLAHINEAGLLTDRGNTLAGSIASIEAESKNSMFWLAPTPECMKKIGALSDEYKCISSAWELLRPDVQEANPGEEMVQRIAEFMEAAFETIRLRVFAQAPLASIIPYIYFQEIRLEQRVDIHATFEAVIRANRELFYCMLTAVPDDCHYQLRSHSSTRRLM